MPPRGKLERDADGKPTGWIAGDNPTISGLFDKLPLPTFAQSVAGTKQFFRELNRLGLTGVSDPGGFNLTAESYRPLFQVWRDSALTVRVVYSLFAQRRGKELEDIQAMTQMLPMGFGDDWLRFNGIGENVTWGLYNNDAPTDAQKQQYYEIARWAASRGMTLTQHWNNNKSVHHLLDVIERVNSEMPIAQLRWSVVHLNDATPESLARMKALGLGWLMQNAMYFQGEAFLRERGNEAMRLTPPIKTALNMGLTVGGGTDAHRVMSYNPFVSLQWMLDGKTVGGTPTRDADEMPSREEALRLYTRGQHLVHPRRGQARHAARRQARRSRGAGAGLHDDAGRRDRRAHVAAHDGRRADRLRGGALSGAGGEVKQARERRRIVRAATAYSTSNSPRFLSPSWVFMAANRRERSTSQGRNCGLTSRTNTRSSDSR